MVVAVPAGTGEPIISPVAAPTNQTPPMASLWRMAWRPIRPTLSLGLPTVLAGSTSHSPLLHLGSRRHESTQPTPGPETRSFKASAFTGKADFYEAYFFLEDVFKRAQKIARPVPTKIAWFPHEALADRLGFALTALQYRKIRAMLNQLADYAHIAEMRPLLQVFSLRPLTPSDATQTVVARNVALTRQSPNLGRIDDLGRAASVGRRKTASAKVYLVPGDGQCFVNGKPAVEYFPRLQEMFKLADPLVASGSLGKYNAWCLVRGGGLSGQAGAISHGLAKAIVLLNPKCRPALARMLIRDSRMVERKKPGQPKARKKFTWVKR